MPSHFEKFWSQIFALSIVSVDPMANNTGSTNRSASWAAAASIPCSPVPGTPSSNDPLNAKTKSLTTSCVISAQGLQILMLFLGGIISVLVFALGLICMRNRRPTNPLEYSRFLNSYFHRKTLPRKSRH